MKKRIFTLFLLFLHLFAVAQVNHHQELINLVVQNKWLEADDFYKNFKDSLGYPPIVLAYKGGIEKSLNHTEDAISYFNTGVDEYASEMDPVLLINHFYVPLSHSYAEIQDYKNAIGVVDKIIDVLEANKSLGTEEYLSQTIESFRKIQRSYKAYSLYPPMKKVYDTTGKAEVSFDNSTHDLLISEVTCNNIPVKGVFDTAATDCCLNMSTAKKLGVKIVSEDSLFMNNLNDNVNAKGVMGIIDSMQIGTVRIYNIPVFIYEDEKGGITSAISDMSKEDIQSSMEKIDAFFSATDIIIGLPVLKLLNNMEWNYENKKLTFYEKSRLHNVKPNLCLYNKGLYLKFYLNDTPQYYTALFDTGGAHGIIINGDFYNENKDLFASADSVDNLRKRTTHGFAAISDYLFLEPKQFDLKIGAKTISLEDNCMISEKEYPGLNTANDNAELIAIGISSFNGYEKVNIDFSNMYIDIE